ncbi:Glycosyltransferase family 34 protein [Pyrenophora tritici-repentis]|nr:Glycosyltransferase family 34 protein [Pyrenophora tritici-repentis]
MLPPRAKRLYRRRTIQTLIVSIIFVVGISVLFASYACLQSHSHVRHAIAPSTTTAPKPVAWNPIRRQANLRIAKATILYDGGSELYEKAISLHDQHIGEGWRYKIHVLRSRIVRGALNKPLWLQEIITSELRKNVEDRVEWILYFDPSVLLQNFNMPLHRFLPPITDVEHFKILSIIAAKPDGKHLSTSVFFMRVSAVSLRILTEAMAAMYNGPPSDNGKVLDTSLQYVLEKDEHREHALFQPASWYNSTFSLFQQPYLPTQAHRIIFLSDALSTSFPLADKDHKLFPDDEAVNVFWDAVAEARRVLDEAKEKGQTAEKGEWWKVVRETRDWVELRAWNVQEVRRRVAVLREGLEIE